MKSKFCSYRLAFLSVALSYFWWGNKRKYIKKKHLTELQKKKKQKQKQKQRKERYTVIKKKKKDTPEDTGRIYSTSLNQTK